MLLAIWVVTAATVMVAAAFTEWLCPEAPYGYQMVLWALFVVSPTVYTIAAWREGAGDGRKVPGADS